jgi:GntR family transcriptional regulator, transcriptional repressor for pyruvate dehydrogenase complex
MSDMSLFENIEPLSRKPVAERVANRLLDLIRTGNLKAGDKLPTENELAAALQVSRPVVREALRGLSILGVVESRQGGRCYVTDLSPSRLLAPVQMVMAVDESNVDALYEARVAVEGELLRLGAARASEADLVRLRQLVRAGYDLASDAVGFRVLDLEFHQTLMRVAGNPFLERVAQSLYELGIEYRRVASEMPGVIARSAAEHDAIVEALAARNPEQAAEAMRAHLNSISRSTFEAMRILGVARRRPAAV